MNDALVYDREIAIRFEDLNEEHRKVLEWVGTNKKVLEIGCNTGYFSAWLKRRSCHVTGVDVSDEAVLRAEKYLDQSFVMDIEKEDSFSVLDGPFDHVIIMHVIEHVRYPEEVLARIAKLVIPGGTIIIALPNIVNLKDRFNVLMGRFEYADLGVMDRTHLKFYTPKTAREMIESAGVHVLRYYGPTKVGIWRGKRVLGRLTRHIDQLIGWISPALSDVVMMFEAEPSK